MIEMLSGALAFAYLMSGMHFLKFWHRTQDRLFLHFALAFLFFAVNQILTSVPAFSDITDGYEYLLRVLGFIFIIAGIAGKNRRPRQRQA